MSVQDRAFTYKTSINALTNAPQDQHTIVSNRLVYARHHLVMIVRITSVAVQAPLCTLKMQTSALTLAHLIQNMMKDQRRVSVMILLGSISGR